MNNNESSSEFFSVQHIELSDNYINVEPLKDYHQSKHGYSQLYRAKRDGKFYILKCLKPEFRDNQRYESILKKEYEIGYELEHANIRNTYSYSNIENMGNTIIMEFVDGRNLRTYIQESKHNKEELNKIIQQICDALAYAHNHQITHRDLKPENIMITHNGNNVKIIDFGHSDTDHHAILKEPAGTYRYIAPEVFSGEKIDFRTDIYSLGIIIKELYANNSSRNINNIINRCCMHSASKRYQSCVAIAYAINKRSAKISASILAAVLIIASLFAYLFYANTNTVSKADFNEIVIPSAKYDKVSEQEFLRRQEVNTEFYKIIGQKYLDRFHYYYSLNYKSAYLPTKQDLIKEKQEFATEYKALLDSMMGSFKESSLYITAARNIVSHNNEMYNTLINQIPSAIYTINKIQYELSTENYEAAKDTQKVMQWIINERKKLNLNPIPEFLLNF